LALRRNEREAFSASTTLQLFRRLADEAKIDVKVGISGAQADARAALVGFDVAGAKVVGRDSETTLRSSGLTTSGKYSAPRMDEHDIVGGWSTSYTRSMNHTARAEMPGSDIASTDQQTKATIRNLAAFVQDEWNFSAGSSAYLGVRWEGIHVQNVELGNMTTSFDSGVWSPIVQGLWRLENKADQLRLGLARTYKAPESSMLISPREINVNNSALNPNFGGNSGLRPELAWALETALEHADPRNVTYNVRAYVRRIKDLQRLSTMLTEHGWETMYVNAGVAQSAGVEADIQFPLTLVTPLLGHTDVRASVARVRSRVDTAPGPDNLLEPNTVEASIGADYRAKAYPFTAGFGFKFANGGWQNLNRVERAFTTATRNLDAYGGWRFSKATQLRISVSNLLQADRSSRKTYHDEAQTVEFAGVASSYRLLRVSLEHKY
jgi:outer membrane receptor protein involved in Fe transport